MNREEVIVEVNRIMNDQLDAGNDTINIAGIILDFLDSIGYDNQEDDDVSIM